MAPAPSSLILPDLFSISSPFHDTTNPFWKRAVPEARRWVIDYEILADRPLAVFFQCQNELLISHCYPFATNYDEFRTCCDFNNLLFILDDMTDQQCADDARKTGDIFVQALRDPSLSDGSKIARMATDVRSRFLKTIKPKTWSRFLAHCDTYMDAVVREAGLRDLGEILGLEDFALLRRQNSGILICLDLVAYCLGIEIPDEVFADPIFQQVYLSAADMVCWGNDLLSYHQEVEGGMEGNNAVTVLMKAQNMDIQAACDFVGRHYKQLMDDFLAGKASLRSFGPDVDVDVKRYIEASQHWPAGNLAWAFETSRYSGPRRDKVLAPMPSH